MTTSLLARYDAGVSAASLARELGVTTQTVYKHLARERGTGPLPRGGPRDWGGRSSRAEHAPYRVIARYPDAQRPHTDATTPDRRYAEKALAGVLEESRLCGYGCVAEVFRGAELVRVETVEGRAQR